MEEHRVTGEKFELSKRRKKKNVNIVKEQIEKVLERFCTSFLLYNENYVDLWLFFNLKLHVDLCEGLLLLHLA